MKELRKKAAMLIISTVLLISTVLYAAFAWYTKNTSVAGMDFKTAKWDVSANYQLDSFTVNVYEYNTIGEEPYAAPGVWGFIPIEMRADGSNTDVVYTITLDKSSLSKEFQDRLYFYYYSGEGNPPENYALPALSDLKELVASGADKTSIIGTVEFGKEFNVECIYWHWLYDYAEYLAYTDPEESAVAQIFELLDGDDAGNVSIFCNYSMESKMFKTENVGPAETYYYKSETPVRIVYDLSNWDSEIVKPDLYLGPGVDAQLLVLGEGESPDPNLIYYFDSYYVPYTGEKPTDGTVIYVKDGLNSYKATVFRYENEVFKKTYKNGTVEYYSLNADAIKAIVAPLTEEGQTTDPAATLTAFRQKMMLQLDSPYANTATFFEEYYEDYIDARDKFDEFDTKVGMNPNAYIDQMNATVIVTGEHTKPEQAD